MRMASCSGGRPRWYPPSPTIETSTPVRPSRRVGTFAPAGTLYFPFGTLPVGAPPACFAMGHLLATGCSVSTNGSGRSYAAARRDRVRAAAAGDRLLPGGCLVHRRVHHAARPARPSGRVRGQREHRLADRLRGRLLGGWIHPPLHWRYAFVTSAALLIAAAVTAARTLPDEPAERPLEERGAGFIQLLSRAEVLRVLVVPFTAFFVFSATF